MKRIKGMIRLLTPPILISLYKRLKQWDDNIPFSGVYSSIDEIHDENPWIQESWIELSENKLKQTGKISQDSFLPTPDFGGYVVLPCLIINLLSQRKPCSILDFGGGTGFAYFKMFPYLLHPENVTYHVVDSNSKLFQVGQKHAKAIKNEKGILFHTELPKRGDIQFDVLYINTALQYIYDYSSLLETLLEFKPQYVILTRLIAGDIKTYITSQNVMGYNTPCVFINFQEIVRIFSKNGFHLVFKAPCKEEAMAGQYDNNVPEHLRIQNTANLIFKRFD